MPDALFSPFLKQCFVVSGAALSIGQFGLVMSFTALLLPQLREPGSAIPIDDVTESWIAAVPTISLLAGNLVITITMGKYGRKVSSCVSVAIMNIGWFCIVLAESTTTLLIARFLQGASLGMSSSLCPIVVGECSSPRNRGAFLTSLSLAMAVGNFFGHATAAYFPWQRSALICAITTFLNLVIVLYSPESPSWLAGQGRYEDSRRVFRWLRGINEEDELNKMIEASVYLNKSNTDPKETKSLSATIKRDINYFIETMKMREFYKPIFIVVHIYLVIAVCGVNVISTFTIDIITDLTKYDLDLPLMVITLDIQRLITSVVAIVIIKKVKRRTVLFASALLNIVAYFSISGYTFAKLQNPALDSPLLGMALLHVLLFSIAMGTLPVPFIITGELFSLRHRSLSGGLSNVFLSIFFFAVIKTFPYLRKSIALFGSFGIYGCVLCYCLVILYFFLPETKDRTLQDIEDDFKGNSLSPVDLKAVETLMS